MDAALLAGRMLSRGALIGLGISSRRVSGPEFVAVLPGFHSPAAALPTVCEICGVLQRDVLPGAVLSHTTAAALLGIALPMSIDGGVALHLPAPAPAVATGGALAARFPAVGVRIHVRDDADRHRSAGGRVTVHRAGRRGRVRAGRLVASAPVVVLEELAALLGHADLVAAVDSVVGPGFAVPGITLEQIGAEVAAPARVRFRRRLLAAVADARPGVESPAETYMRLLVTAAGFPEPAVNVSVRESLSGRVRRIDGAYVEARIGIEYDGDVHRVVRDRWREDEARRDGLAADGWILRRLTGADLRDPDAFLTRLHRACVERGVPVPEIGSWRGRVLLPGASELSPRRW
ncbi:hypothetical protein GCM10027268_12690 [Brachybacterium huguangmaarense]